MPSRLEPALTVDALLQERHVADIKAKRQAELDAVHQYNDHKVMLEWLTKGELDQEEKLRLASAIRQAFMAKERDLLIFSFPSDGCSDSGRRITNRLEGWQDTLPPLARQYHDWWRRSLQPGGFGFSARIIDYPNGMPGDVGLFISWPAA